MKRILEFLKNHKYFLVMLILCSISIVLSITYSSYFVESNNHRAAEMYIGELKYSISIDGSNTNTLTVPSGETIIDVDVNNLNPVDTYYKLLYLSNSNIEIRYFSETKDTDEVKTSYKLPNDSVLKSSVNNLKLLITNNSTISQNIGLTLKGGYINNTLSDISVPNGYSEITALETPATNTYFCKTTETLTQGLEYVNGQYTYRYMQEAGYSSWINITNDGWGVQFTNNTSTVAATSKLCTYINNKSIVSMAFMFFDSQVATVDLSSFDTSDVTNMSSMFAGSQATVLDLSGFDTSSVTNMSGMFASSQATTVDLSGFNTSNVTDMSSMFNGSQATAIDLSSFDTSNVTNMSGMFYGSVATMLDLSSFDTSNVTDMTGMFYYNKAITIDLSSFDTHNVTNMKNMFCESQATVLDLSSFDTRKVTNMAWMFYNSTKLKTIYASSKFNTDAVTSSSNMFSGCTNLVGGSGTKYDSSYTNKTYGRIDGGTSSPGYFTDVADKPSTFDTDDWATIVKSVKAGNTRKYKVGDTKEVDLGTTYGTHTIRIANTSTPSECATEGFSQTACGFVLEFADIITKNKMNDTATNVGGWPASSLRTFVNNDIYNALPSDLKNGIIDTTVVSSHGKDDSSNFTSTDKLYLLAPKELYSDFDLTFDTAKDLTRQLDYYKNEGVTTSNYSKAIKKYNSTATWWWFRSASSINNYIFYFVYDDGDRHDNIANSTNGVSPAFRIG